MIAGGQYGEIATQIFTALPLAYICGSAYYSLFKLVIFSYYRMVPKATEPRSLLLNAGQVCRFAAPLAFNFMHIIRMNEVHIHRLLCGRGFRVCSQSTMNPTLIWTVQTESLVRFEVQLNKLSCLVRCPSVQDKPLLHRLFFLASVCSSKELAA